MLKEINGQNYDIPDEFNWVDFTDKHFNNAFCSIINGNDDLFIQSRAGGGKSLLIKIASRMMKNTIVLSTTGITALALTTDNITAHTLHSFLQINPQDILDSHNMTLYGKNKRILEKTKCIIIDEVSMMSNQLFDHMCDKLSSLLDDIPRLILFGDVMQLPPVVANNKVVKQFYDSVYNGNVMFFNSNWYKSLKFKKLVLRKSFRQDDVDLADMLFQIGYNDHSDLTLDYFNSRVMDVKTYEKNHPEFMFLSPINDMVNKINNDYIKSLSGKEMLYKASISSDWPKNKQIPDKEIIIKEGAQIICNINHYGESIDDNSTYRNGQIGIVLKVYKDCVLALIEGKEIFVQRSTINNTETTIDKNGTFYQKIIGNYRQIDCKVAKSITCHKAQGKTIKNVYFVPGNWLPQGLVYVALSRVSSLDGLGLQRPLTMKDIQVNQEAWDFLEAN